MVERYFPAATQAALGEAARQAQEAAISMSGEGLPVRYLRSMFAPSDEWCFFITPTSRERIIGTVGHLCTAWPNSTANRLTGTTCG